MDNVIGIPVIRVGTNEAEPILTGNFRNARRGTGEGAIRWKRMENNDDWQLFVEGMWEYQWTKTDVAFTEEISDVLYQETQGIIDILIKLYKMVQWRAISLGGDEIITTDLIRQVAQDGLYLVKPMLEAIRSGNLVQMKKYRDIAPLDVIEYREKCLNQMNFEDLALIRRQQRKQQKSQSMSPLIKQIISELLELEVDAHKAKLLAERMIQENPDEDNISKLVNLAYKIVIGGESYREANKAKTKKPKTAKLDPEYIENDMRVILQQSQAENFSVYEKLVEVGIVKDTPQEDFCLSYVE
jgi:hypothetical protein